MTRKEVLREIIKVTDQVAERKITSDKGIELINDILGNLDSSLN